MTTPDSTPQEKPATAATGDHSQAAGRQAHSQAGPSASAMPSETSSSNLKAGLVLVLVLFLVLIAGAGYLVKNNESVARQLLGWNFQLPGWLLPPSLSEQGADAASGSFAVGGASDPRSSDRSSSVGSVTVGPGASSTAGSTGSAGAEAIGNQAAATAGSGQGGDSPMLPPSAVLAPAPVRPTPQLDPSFRQALNGIDQVARALLVLPAGPQKPRLPEAQAPKPSGSLLAGAENQLNSTAQAPAESSAHSNPTSPDAMLPMLEPGVFEKSLDFLRSLVRVQSVQGPEFAGHSQAFYQLVSQQMQAQLAAARLALLLGEVSLASRELAQTETLLDRHFDKNDPKVFQLQAEFAGLKRQVESLQ